MVAGLAAHVEGAVQVGLAPENVVILVNDAVPESVRLGTYYAEKRGIPMDNICHLKTSDKEVVSRDDYNKTIEQPVDEFLKKRLGQVRVALPEGELILRLAQKQVRCLVSMWGVPLKIDGFIDTKDMYKSTAAGVDSELALLPQGGHVLNGARPNPYFAQDAAFNDLYARYMLLVCRLDGPAPQVVQRMIDDALWAEKNGLQGRAYFDVRNTKAPGYVEGDQWIRAAYKDFQEQGIKCVIDEQEEVFPVSYPMPEAMFYLGWYTDTVSGPMSRPDFKFVRGAVAYHLHSFSAWTVRTTTEKWAGPLLAHGAAATMGSVYEPFLTGTPYLDIFANRLVRGYTFAESCYMSQRLLSWMTVFLGDPLYRPFLKPVRPPTTAEPPPPGPPASTAQPAGTAAKPAPGPAKANPARK
jgi:uncharacterized protein (TIGR03790 family)